MSKETALVTEALLSIGEGKPSNKEWNRLKSEPEWADLEQGVHDPEVDARECAEWVKQSRLSAPLIGMSPRVRARSLCLYAMAQEEPDVQQFRSSVLGSDRVPFEEIASWASLRRKELLPRLPMGYGPRGKTDQLIAVQYLEKISSEIASRYGWSDSQAALFILGEFVPVSSGIVRRELVTQKGTRIVLEIDPSVPTEEVVASFIEGRAHLGRKSGRMPSDKNLNLVSKFIERGEPPFLEMARKEHRTVKDVRLTIGRTWKMLTQHAYERSAE